MKTKSKSLPKTSIPHKFQLGEEVFFSKHFIYQGRIVRINLNGFKTKKESSFFVTYWVLYKDTNGNFQTEKYCEEESLFKTEDALIDSMRIKNK